MIYKYVGILTLCVFMLYLEADKVLTYIYGCILEVKMVSS